MVALAVWMQRLSGTWLLVAAAAAGIWTLGLRSRREWWRVGAALALVAAVVVAAAVQVRLREISRDWSQIRTVVEEHAAESIAEALDDLVDRGERAVEGVGRIAETLPAGTAQPAAFTRLDALRRTTGMSSLAIYGPAGNPIVWAGEHRGVVPDSVRTAQREYTFHQGPLFGYLYFAQPLDNGRTAVAAVLLHSAMPAGPAQPPFAQRFAERRGIEPRFMAPDRAEGEAVWDWTVDTPILSVSFARLTQEAWHGRTAERGRWLVASAWLGALALLVFGWYFRRPGPATVPVIVLTASFLLFPVGLVFGGRGLFSPLHFVLPGPADVTLGRLLILLLGLALLILLHRPGAASLVARFRPPGWLGVALVALAVPLVLELVHRSASLGLMTTRPAGGLALIGVATLMIALPVFVLLRHPAAAAPRRPVAAPVVAGVLLAAVLALAVVLAWHPSRSAPTSVAAIWALPFGLFYYALARSRSVVHPLTAWLLAGWLAGTAAVAFSWTQHLDARIDAAEAELAHLGTEPDPYLDYLLRQFAERAFFLAAEGEDGVNLLYRSWVASGLAREGYEARLTEWRGDQVVAELAFSDLQFTEEFADRMLERARGAEEPLLERYNEHEAVHYLLLLPLPDERVVSVATPPRRRLGRATPLARFLHMDEPVLAGAEYDRLTLVPSPAMPMEAAAVPLLAHGVEWVGTRAGWRSETVVPFPTGPMHAHLQVVVPSPWMLLVRGLLVMALVLATFTLLWAVARALCGEVLHSVVATLRRVRTFRGRLTLALFGFFLLPTLALGVVAYGAFSQQTVRTGAALALRSLELAAPDVAMLPLTVLGDRVRADLLLYREGGLVGASAREIIDLGLFQSWLPPSVETAFTMGEETEALQEQRLAGNPYLVAYRRIGDDGVLAAPVPLASGEIARMQREFAHGFLLMMILGACLSVVLAFLVGRALSRPMEMLSRATAAVGAGNLRLRLPEDRPDEFGGVYRAFNRMVRRLRRARASEVRTARVLAWGEMARQVAHEIKNPLTPIKLSVQHLRRAHSDGRPDFDRILERNVEAILREIDRLGHIARAFARFGAPREEAGTLERVMVERVVDETLVLYRGGKDDIEYHVEVDSAVPPVVARDGELREVLLNLLENAREAVDGDGRIRVSATLGGAGEWVQLEVHDNGVGIPPDQLPRIFEPQFSTRTSGTGLGLAIVRRLVESWGGQISVSSEPGSGTTVHLRLRTADGDEPQVEVAPEQEPGRPKRRQLT